MADSSESEHKEKLEIKFIPKKRKALRQRRTSDSDEEEDRHVIQEKIEEMKIIQKLRERPNGVSVLTLALGEKVTQEEETLVSDPFKVKPSSGGGLVNMAALKGGKFKPTADDAYDVGIGTQFSAETNKRDEDDEMMKYIEEELSKRKGEMEANGKGLKDSDERRYLSPEEAALNSIPDYLRASSSHRSEEMLSNQMLSGIPEVDLGIEAKIRNIEATEEAKLKLLRESKNKNEGPSHFVPTNMAVNFVQHNRFTIDEPSKDKSDQSKKLKTVPPINQTGKNKEKATDDYHYEKFKKQFRRF